MYHDDASTPLVGGPYVLYPTSRCGAEQGNIIIIIKRRSGINPIPPTVRDRDYKETKANESDKLLTK